MFPPSKAPAINVDVIGLMHGHMRLIPEAWAEVERQPGALGTASDRQRRPDDHQHHCSGHAQEQKSFQHLQKQHQCIVV
jgi:hypothetical protein